MGSSYRHLMLGPDLPGTYTVGPFACPCELCIAVKLADDRPPQALACKNHRQECCWRIGPLTLNPTTLQHHLSHDAEHNSL